MHPGELFRCDSCGQTVRVTREGTLTDRPAQFCPFCGRPELAAATSTFTSLEAPAFGALPRKLAQLLYEQWAGTPSTRAQFPAFVDYFYAVLKGGSV